MLKGLEIVEINYSDLKEEYSKLRLDAEFYKKEYVQFTKTIKKKDFLKIGQVSFVTDGIHESIDFDKTSEINLISAKSPKENYFDLTSNHHISSKQNQKNPRTELQENDVIISTVGTIGNCAVVRKNILPANSDRHVGIVRIKEKIKPYFLSTFLLSKYGRFQTLRESTGNVQLNLFIYKIKELIIPNLSNKFQSKIDFLCSLAYDNRIQSKNNYTQAENLLLDEIGLQNFEPSKEPVNIKSFKDSFGTSGRLDAEYYQKKYEQVVNKVKNKPFDILSNLVDIKKSIEPGSKNYVEKGLPFMRVADLSKNGLSEPQKYISDYFVKENQDKINNLKPKKGTILFSKDGSVGIAYHLRENYKGITSGAILHLNVKDENRIVPEYLTLALNSKVVQMQAERDAGGSIILHWRSSEIENVVVPIIDYKKQQQIADLIEQSFTLKKQSEHLLEVAKRAVEIAIEENEAIAFKYINQETK